MVRSPSQQLIFEPKKKKKTLHVVVKSKAKIRN